MQSCKKTKSTLVPHVPSSRLYPKPKSSGRSRQTKLTDKLVKKQTKNDPEPREPASDNVVTSHVQVSKTNEGNTESDNKDIIENISQVSTDKEWHFFDMEDLEKTEPENLTDSSEVDKTCPEDMSQSSDQKPQGVKRKRMSTEEQQSTDFGVNTQINDEVEPENGSQTDEGRDTGFQNSESSNMMAVIKVEPVWADGTDDSLSFENQDLQQYGQPSTSSSTSFPSMYQYNTCN